MNEDKMGWIDEREAERSKEYFNIKEGENCFFLLSYTIPLAQVWDNASKQYRVAVEGDKNASIKGICWVLQDEMIKLARLPYTAVKQLRAYQTNKEWELGEFPWAHQVTLTAKGAGTKEVEYTTTLSPKKTKFSQEILNELVKKDPPEMIVENIKSKAQPDKPIEYPEGSNPADIPF